MYKNYIKYNKYIKLYSCYISNKISSKIKIKPQAVHRSQRRNIRPVIKIWFDISD